MGGKGENGEGGEKRKEKFLEGKFFPRKKSCENIFVAISSI